MTVLVKTVTALKRPLCTRPGWQVFFENGFFLGLLGMKLSFLLWGIKRLFPFGGFRRLNAEIFLIFNIFGGESKLNENS